MTHNFHLLQALFEETITKNAERDENARRSTAGDTKISTMSSSVDYGIPAKYGSMQNEESRVSLDRLF